MGWLDRFGCRLVGHNWPKGRSLIFQRCAWCDEPRLSTAELAARILRVQLAMAGFAEAARRAAATAAAFVESHRKLMEDMNADHTEEEEALRRLADG